MHTRTVQETAQKSQVYMALAKCLLTNGSTLLCLCDLWLCHWNLSRITHISLPQPCSIWISNTEQKCKRQVFYNLFRFVSMTDRERVLFSLDHWAVKGPMALINIKTHRDTPRCTHEHTQTHTYTVVYSSKTPFRTGVICHPLTQYLISCWCLSMITTHLNLSLFCHPYTAVPLHQPPPPISHT